MHGRSVGNPKGDLGCQAVVAANNAMEVICACITAAHLKGCTIFIESPPSLVWHYPPLADILVLCPFRCRTYLKAFNATDANSKTIDIVSNTGMVHLLDRSRDNRIGRDYKCMSLVERVVASSNRVLTKQFADCVIDVYSQRLQQRSITEFQQFASARRPTQAIIGDPDTETDA
jgi:hypothetical protein